MAVVAAALSLSLFGAPAPSVAYVVHSDDAIRSDLLWAISVWSELLVGPAAQIPVHAVVQPVGTKQILGTFSGCSPTCLITIDPRALPDLGRVTLLHELGHALGFTHGLATPFAQVEREFGSRSSLWVDGAHWADTGEGLLMHTHISHGSRISSSSVFALAGVIGATPNACAHSSQCSSRRSCTAQPWPRPSMCTRSKYGHEKEALGIAAVASTALATIIIV